MLNGNYYEILDVKLGESLAEITRIYEKLSLIHHSNEKRQLLNIAYETLKDSKKLKQYDIKDGFNQTVSSTISNKQAVILTCEKRDIYLKILDELLPPIKD